MTKTVFLSLAVFFCLVSTTIADQSPTNRLPQGFVYLDDIAPAIRVDLRYRTDNNFLGTRVDGYGSDRCILTREAALALARVQAELAPFGLGLMVFDAFRPQRAVDHFVRWAKNLDDTQMKAIHYPDVPKTELFKRGYIASRSGHSRGSTVDLTLVSLGTGKALDMGTVFDYFSPDSWPDSMAVPAAQRAFRLLLRSMMIGQGFQPYAQEWWHFTLKNEPFPDTYFDFPIQ